MLEEGKVLERSVFSLFIFLAVFASPIVASAFLGVTFAPVLSSSMEPVISAGDLEIAKSVETSALSVGDILILRDEQSQALVSHRIIQIESTSDKVRIHTKGDNNPNSDNYYVSLKSNTSVPKVLIAIPKMGGYIEYLSTPQGKRLSGGILLTSLALFLLRFGFPRTSKLKEVNNDSTLSRNLHS